MNNRRRLLNRLKVQANKREAILLYKRLIRYGRLSSRLAMSAARNQSNVNAGILKEVFVKKTAGVGPTWPEFEPVKIIDSVRVTGLNGVIDATVRPRIPNDLETIYPDNNPLPNLMQKRRP